MLLHPPLPPPGVLVGGFLVDDGRSGGGSEGRSVVVGLGGGAGREGLGTDLVELGLGTGGGFDGRGGPVPPSVGVSTKLPSQ
jgi:hypothetical protein